MARLPEVTSREAVSANQRHIYDAIATSRGLVSGPFPVLMNSPEVAGRIAHVGAYLRFESILPAPMRELAILTTASHWNCEVEWAAHREIALQVGVSQEAIEAVRRETALENLKEAEALVVRYGRGLLQAHHVSDGLFRAVRKKCGDKGVTELTAVIGYYSMLACVLNAFEVTPSGGRDLPLVEKDTRQPGSA